MSQEKGQARPVEEETADDPTRHEEGVPPPEETSGDERRERVAGRDRDVSDEETYESGPGW